MSTPTTKPADKQDQPLGQAMGAPTLLETALEARRRKGEQASADQIDTSKPQWKTKEMNPGADDPADGKKLTEGRRIQQDPAKGEDEAKTLEFVHHRLFGDRGKKPADGEPKTTPQPKSTDKKEEKKVEVKKTAPPKPLGIDDVSRIAESAATAATLALADRLQGEKKQNKEEETDDLESLSEDDRYNHEVASHMAEKFGDKYKDLPRQIVEASKTKRAYEENWKKEHPGEDFDWDAEEHASFLEQNQPKVNDRDFRRAEVSIEANKIADEKIKETRGEIDAIEARAISTTLNQAASIEAKKAVDQFKSAFAPEAEWDLNTKAGREAVIENDPLIGPVAVKWSTILAKATGELVKIFDGKSRDGRSLFKVDEKNELHQWITNVVDQYEDKLSSLPKDKVTNDNGQTFVPRDQWNKLTPDQRNRHWTIKRDEAMWIVRESAKENAEYEKSLEVDRMEKLAKANGWRFNRDSIVTQRRKQIGAHTDGIDNASGGADPAGFGAGDDAPSSDGGGPKIDTLRTDIQHQNKQFSEALMHRLFPREKP